MNLFPIMQRKSRILIICQFAFVNVNTPIRSGVTELNHKSNVSVDIEETHILQGQFDALLMRDLKF